MNTKNRHFATTIARLLLCTLALTGWGTAFYSNTPIIISDYLKMNKHRNPLKYIERFYLNTYFKLNLPGGKKAFCYRPLKTKIDMGMKKPRKALNVTSSDMSSLLYRSSIRKQTKKDGTFTFLNDVMTWNMTSGVEVSVANPPMLTESE
jgi:hypothetical protein